MKNELLEQKKFWPKYIRFLDSEFKTRGPDTNPDSPEA